MMTLNGRNFFVLLFLIILQQDTSSATPHPGQVPFDVVSAADIYSNDVHGGYGYVDSGHHLAYSNDDEGWSSPTIIEKFGPIPQFKAMPAVESHSYDDGYASNYKNDQNEVVSGGYADGPPPSGVPSPAADTSPAPTTKELIDGARTVVKGAVARVRTHFRRKVDRVRAHFGPKVKRVVGHFQGKAKRIAERIQARVAKIEAGGDTIGKSSYSSSYGSSSSHSQGYA